MAHFAEVAMNHDKPRQRQSDGRWDYTTSNRRTGTYPIGYCTGPGSGSQVAPYHHDGHLTAAAACACYQQYLLDHSVRYTEDGENPPQLHRCAVAGCRRYTSGRAEIGDGWLWDLCARHRNRETLATLLQVGEVWHS